MKKIILSMLAVATLISCNNDKNEEENPITTTALTANQSVTPVLLKKQAGFEKLELFSLISSDDVLAGSPSYVFGGSADGSGLLKNTDGTFTFLVNQED